MHCNQRKADVPELETDCDDPKGFDRFLLAQGHDE
jgi:hypothetical protein